MPDMDGYTLAQRLREIVAEPPPMLMLTSAAMRGDAEQCKALGISAYFPKPVSPDDLRLTLCQLARDTQASLSTRCAGYPPYIKGSAAPNGYSAG